MTAKKPAMARRPPNPANYEPAFMVVVHRDFGPKVQATIKRFLYDWPVHGLSKATKNAVKRGLR